MKPHALYRFYAADSSLLYVGITCDLGRRWDKHSHDKPWWAEVSHSTVEHFASRAAVLAAEKHAIHTEMPRFNIQHNAPPPLPPLRPKRAQKTKQRPEPLELPTISNSETWRIVDEYLRSLGGQCGRKVGREHSWWLPSTTGGSFSVEIGLKPRWCSVAIDRWKTTDRMADADEWFEQNIWPLVRDAIAARRSGWGTLPNGSGAYSSATPIRRSELLPLLELWIPKELSWGVTREEMLGRRRREAR